MNFGLTFENNTNPKRAAAMLQRLKKPVVRQVIQPHTAPEDYISFLRAIAPYCTLMIAPLDSSRIAGLGEKDVPTLLDACLKAFAPIIRPTDSFELGNEVGGGSQDNLHQAKTIDAFNWAIGKPFKKALTGYAVEGYLEFLASFSPELRASVDIFLMSDYPKDGCFSPSKIDWAHISELFPNVDWMGIGECGLPMHRDDVPKGTPTYSQHLVLASMRNFAELRSPVAKFTCPIFWWYGSQMLAQPAAFDEFKRITDALP